jgi:hypothetical protein
MKFLKILLKELKRKKFNKKVIMEVKMKKRNIFLLVTLLFILLGCRIGIDKRLVARDVIRKTNQQYIIIRV